MFDLNAFSAEIFAPTLTILGVVGNFFGIVVSSRRALAKLGPQTIYTCLFIFDSLNFPLILKPYLQYAFNFDITNISGLSCKGYWYVSYALATISPMINVFISIERFISLAYPSRKFFLRKKSVQLVYTALVTLFNLLIYIPIALYFDKMTIQFNQTMNSSNETMASYVTCDFTDHYWLEVLGYLDLSNRVIMPSVLMILFSLLIILTIFRSRQRVSVNIQANRTLKRDIRFALLSIFLNLVYIAFSLPVSILVLFPFYYNNEFYVFFTFVYFVAYSANFYLMIFVNRLFREKFFSLFYKRKSNQAIRNRGTNAVLNRP